MASNFHNILGFLAAGVDVHKGLMPVPAPPGFVETLCAELVVAHPFVMGPGQVGSVKFNGVNSVLDGHTSFVSWPHYPLFPTNILWPVDLVFGTHSCWLPRSTVQITGTMATCAIASCFSTDLDCWEWAPIPSDLTLQFGTVQTTPSPFDFAYGAIRAIVNGGIGFLINKGFKAIGGKFTAKWTDKLGNALTKRGTGYKFARALGKPLMSDFLDSLGNASRQKISGASWAAGRRLVNAFLGKALPSSMSSVASAGLSAFGFNPGTVAAQQIAGAPPGQKPSWNPFGGFKGAGMLDSKVPLYGAVHGGVQAVGGP
ncbi:MAG: hypothetical protein U0441_08340 [Polyangiaceae bacterium]